jgi:hypothetical protein
VPSRAPRTAVRTTGDLLVPADHSGCLNGVIIVSATEVAVCPVCHVPHSQIGGRAEARAICGVTFRAFSLWREGRNLAGRGPFPTPIAELESGPIWDLRAVRAWIKPRKRGRRKAVDSATKT